MVDAAGYFVCAIVLVIGISLVLALIELIRGPFVSAKEGEKEGNPVVIFYYGIMEAITSILSR